MALLVERVASENALRLSVARAGGKQGRSTGDDDTHGPRLVPERRGTVDEILHERRSIPLSRTYFVGEAMARDLILWNAHGIQTGRVTRNIDLGVLIEEWDVFVAIKAHFKNLGRCDQDPKVGHRLLFRHSFNVLAVPVDLLPFGGIENPDCTIAWPPESEGNMMVAGFVEGSRSAVHVQVDANLIVPTASLPAQAVLKLIAWMDRGQRIDKDANDFLLLISNCHAADKGSIHWQAS